MAINQDLPATDSAAALHELIGQDSTATFENDPKFEDSNPVVDASSENLQTRNDRQEIQSAPSLDLKAVDDDDDEDEDDEDEDFDDDENDDDEDLDDEDEDDELDDEEDDDEDDYEDDDGDDEEDEEDEE